MTISLDRLADGAAALGFALDDSQLRLFDQYARLLIEGASAFNLTSVRDPDGVVDRHFLDSLSVLAALPAGARRLIDVGSGAGLPGIPIKIARPAIEVALLEATGKKARWLGVTADALGLTGVGVLPDRAETVGSNREHRERYDVAVARAVAPLAVLCELCLPFVCVGGQFIAQKSVAGAEVEAPAAQTALDVLGGRLVEVRPIEHPALPNRALVVIEKLGRTPPQYPRRPGLPAKRPL